MQIIFQNTFSNHSIQLHILSSLNWNFHDVALTIWCHKLPSPPNLSISYFAGFRIGRTFFFPRKVSKILKNRRSSIGMQCLKSIIMICLFEFIQNLFEFSARCISRVVEIVFALVAIPVLNENLFASFDCTISNYCRHGNQKQDRLFRDLLTMTDSLFRDHLCWWVYLSIWS